MHWKVFRALECGGDPMEYCFDTDGPYDEQRNCRNWQYPGFRNDNFFRC